MVKKRVFIYIYVCIGAFILAFGIYNIHHVCHISEGGELGLELLFDHWFSISPSISAPIIDIISYSFGYFVLGNHFLEYAIVATGGYSIFYHIIERYPPILPDLSGNPLLASILGAIFVGIGCGMVIRIGGACSGDDAIALVLSTKLKVNISYCYLLTDMIVLGLSLTYIPFQKIIYSFITVILSSMIIGLFQKK